MWDVEVDIACIGTGVGALANAIATVDAGGEVLMADAAAPFKGEAARVTTRERVDAVRGWLVHDTVDVETNEYLAAVTEGVLDSPGPALDACVPLRGARNLSRDEAYGRTVEPFRGSRLNGWAAQCLTSSYGLLYSSMRNWPTTSMRSSDGDAIEVLAIGAVTWGEGFGEGDLRQWIAEQVLQRDIEVRTGSTLQRIVFEEGRVAGVVLSTPDGPYAVRTRAGVTFAPRDQEPRVEIRADVVPGDSKQVCLVGRTASRYGRVELLDTAPAEAVRPTCTGSRRAFREGMHESRQSSLEGWRCGNVQGYPSFGQ